MDERVTNLQCSHSPKTYGDVRDLITKNCAQLFNPDLKCSGSNTSTEKCDRGVDKLWICLDCGFVACGHYDNRHSTDHYQEKAHPLFLNLKEYRIWCFSCNVFVSVVKFPDFVARTYRDLQRKKDSTSQPLASSKIVDSKQIQQKPQSLDLKTCGQVPIVNNHSTCYASAVLQALAHLSYFNRWFWALAPYIQQGTFNTEYEGLEDMVTTHFCQMMQVLQLPDKINQIQCQFEAQKTHLQPFYRALQAYKKVFVGDQQQDAQEFVLFLFDCIRSSLQRKFPIGVLKQQTQYNAKPQLIHFTQQQIQSKHRDIVSDCFEGQQSTCSVYQCQYCKKESKTYTVEPFSTLSLHVTKNQVALEQSFQTYISPQTMESKCQNCQNTSHIIQTQKILYPPPILCLHFMCFEADEKEKIKTNLQNLTNLNIFNYLSELRPGMPEFNEDDIQYLYKSLLAQKFTYQIVEQFYLKSQNKQFNDQAFNQTIEPLLAYIICLPDSQSIAIKLAQQLKVLKAQPPKLDSEQKTKYILECIANEYYEIAKFGTSKTDFLKDLLQNLQSCKIFKQIKVWSVDELSAGCSEYELQCAILHTGNLASGHYTTVCKKQNEWIQFDDANIKSIVESAIKDPYLLFYQKKKSLAQEILTTDIYQQILNSLNSQPCAKICQDLYDQFFRHAISYSYSFGSIIKFQLTDKCISGEWLYRLHQLPWPRANQFAPLDPTLHQYAIQPAMVPSKVPINGFLWQLIEAVFGECGELVVEKGENVGAQQLFDRICCNSIGKPVFALSRTFVKELSEHAFYDAQEPGFANLDLIRTGAPLSRFSLREGLVEGTDFVVVGRQEWMEIQTQYGGLEIQLWQRNDIYGLPEEVD
ncbi:Ubiquitin carboxyl-terminal hydrolase family protein [Spironucleus salmonicida]|uniref:Ubiquitin carboxyl-terminal hydrolase family protein n=1 Tax=Spironucleus salmonicida TaxID=348837 RepID=V6LSX1_9EUKA|nr:Ubiquitin carboxyl-terminal hydrolase family protein [Spironucleus salmonicida]|eukprot:EST43894.1 Ubiquitin carboxyl-terminal hydrolase family protein [Spironucleus salmonicida]